jgi:hypothetical protein
MVKIILGVLSLLVMLSCSTTVKENTIQPNIMETKKKISEICWHFIPNR